MNHKPSVRGGNGSGATVAQQTLKDALGPEWVMEFALSLGRRTPGWPTCYKIDLANLRLQVAIEVDGFSHVAMVRKEQDRKKTEKLISLGWKVLRFTNKAILNWQRTTDVPGIALDRLRIDVVHGFNESLDRLTALDSTRHAPPPKRFSRLLQAFGA